MLLHAAKRVNAEENIHIFRYSSFSYEKASFFLRLVAIVMRGSGTTELNGEITNK